MDVTKIMSGYATLKLCFLHLVGSMGHVVRSFAFGA
jgi:hypothetical protein